MMKLNRLLCTVSVLILPVSAWAYDDTPSPTQEATAGVAGAVSVGTSYLSYRKFRAASEERNAAMEITGISSLGAPKAFSAADLQSMEGKLTTGDEVSIVHYLNPEDNKQLHLSNKQSEISSHESSALTYRNSAMMAMMPRTETYTDNEGHLQTRTVGPNYMSAMYYNNLASTEENAASQGRADLAVMRGQPASSFDKIALTERVKSSANSVAAAVDKIKAMGASGGEIVQVSRIPEKVVAAAAAKRLVGGALAAAAAASMLTSAEELLHGAVANAISGTNSNDGADSRFDSGPAY